MTAGDFSWGAPEFLWGAVFVVGAAGYLIWRRYQGLEPGMVFSSGQLAARLPKTFWSRLRFLPDVLRILALFLFVGALARPQLVGQPKTGDSDGIDIVLALDTSCSMQAADFQPKDRMFVAKDSIERFVKSRSADRIGLVVFAGEASTWVPLTLDYSLLSEMLAEVEVGMLPDGTAIGSAIGTALNRIRKSDAKSRVVILLTDGDNNAGNITPRQAAKLAKELSVRVYTILIGRGGPVPFPAGKDMFGRVVMRTQTVPTNPELLEEIAQSTGGEAYRAEDGKELDQRLTDVLDSLEKSRLDGSINAIPREEIFWIFIAFGFVLMLAEIVLRMTRLRSFP